MEVISIIPGYKTQSEKVHSKNVSIYTSYLHNTIITERWWNSEDISYGWISPTTEKEK